MGMKPVILLLSVVAQALSAPSGCIESCSSYHRFYQTQSSGGHQNADLTQAGSQLPNLDFSKPGNWTEQNQYRTDGGNGRVYEEKGQYVEGPKRVRFYKKNYTSSYSTGNVNGADLTAFDEQNRDLRYGTQGVSEAQRAYNQFGSVDSHTRQREYGSIQSQHHVQTASGSTNAHSERLEDFGERSGSTQVTQGASDFSRGTQGQNWSRTNSYKTDGGHGQVFEEEGQYATGPKKVHYYEKNYTSGYSISGTPVHPLPTGVHDVQRELEKLHQEIGRNIQQVSTAGGAVSSNIGQTEVLGIHRADIEPVQTNQYGLHGSAISSATQHNAFTSDGRSVHLPYRSPSIGSFNTESRSSYERREGYTRGVETAPQYVISPTIDYTQVHTGGSGGYNMNNMNTVNTRTRDQQRVMEQMRHAESSDMHQSAITAGQHLNNNMRQNVYGQNLASHSSAPGNVGHYKENWSSSSHTREASGPFASDMVHANQEGVQYNRNQYGSQHGSYRTAEEREAHSNQYRENNFNSAYRTTSGNLVTGTHDLGHIGHTADCDHDTTQQVQYGSRYNRKYKRHAKYDELSDMQQHQTADLTQQSEDLTQQNEDLTQQSEDLTQQTSGKLEFGQHPQQSNRPRRPTNGQHSDDLTQQSEDLTQQTTGNLEFGQQSQKPQRPTSGNQHVEDLTQQSEDLTQQTGGFEDFTQQTSGNLEFGQHSQKPQRPTTGNQRVEDLTQQSEDLTQQTGGFDDFTQQTSGNLEFGQQSQKPQKPTSGNQHVEDLTQQNEDLTQQTGGFDDFTQQTSGNLEFGQHSQKPQRPTTGNQRVEDLTQQSEDLTQQTGGFDDFTQQTSGNLEFGQHSQKPQRPTTGNQRVEDLTQQSEDLTQQTGGFDDFTQQTSGNLEFGQHSQKPQRPTTGNQRVEDLTQQSEDLTQQTGGFDDFTQQTSGKLEFGQHSRKPPRSTSGNQHSADFTQQNEDLTQQTGGFDDFTQQTGGFNDFTQQTAGHLEFGQQSQRPRKPTSGNQHLENLTQQNEDLTQQTGGFDDFTQQTSGNLEFGQQSHKPQRLPSHNQHIEDLTQQTGGFNDFTQQTSGKLEFGQHTQKPQRPTSGNQHIEDLTEQNEDLTQQAGGFDDFNHPSGKLEFGQHTQKPQRPTSGNQHMEDLSQQNEDLTQQTGGFDDFNHPSGKLEFGQHTQKPQRPTSGNQHMEDLSQQNEDFTQQTGGFNDFNHHSGKLEFGQQTQYPSQSWKPVPSNQHMEDLSQQTGGFDDFAHTDKLELGQQTMNQKYEDVFQQYEDSGKLGKEDLTQQSVQHPQEITQSTNDNVFNQGNNGESNTSGSQSQEPSGATPWDVIPKPAQKPRPRPRYQRVGYLDNSQGTNSKVENNVNKPENSHAQETSRFDGGIIPVATPPQVNRGLDTGDLKKEDLRGDQGIGKPTTESYPKKPNHPGKVNAFHAERENGDQVNWLHKSNDATVGLQWHYTYHPSDLTNSEPVPSSYYPGLNYHSRMHSRAQQGRLFGQYPPHLDQHQGGDEDLQQQTRPSIFGQQQTQDRDSFADMYQSTRNTESSHSQHNSHDQYEAQNQDRFGGRFQQTTNTEQSHSRYNNFDKNSELYQQSNAKELEPQSQLTQKNENTPKEVGFLEFGHQPQSGVKGHRRPRPTNAEPVLEPRILEAYGGGPYDATHSDDIYNKVTVNPSVTLPPLNAEDPWEIHEKPRVLMGPMTQDVTTTESTQPIEPTEPTTETTSPPTFWGKLGHKITNTFDKAKEKARGIFG